MPQRSNRAQHDLGVRRGAKTVGAQLPAELGKVVELAVVGDPTALLAGHRLVAVLDVDDAQTTVREPHVTVLVDPHAGVVGAAVLDEGAHHLQAPLDAGDLAAIEGDHSTDTAHGLADYPPTRGARAVAWRRDSSSMAREG